MFRCPGVVGTQTFLSDCEIVYFRILCFFSSQLYQCLVTNQTSDNQLKFILKLFNSPPSSHYECYKLVKFGNHHRMNKVCGKKCKSGDIIPGIWFNYNLTLHSITSLGQGGGIIVM